MSKKKREEKTLQQLLDAKLEKLAQDLLDEIEGYDIPHSSVVVSKTPSDGVGVSVRFKNLVREEYEWKAATLTPLEKQFSALAEKHGFDWAYLISGGSGDGHTNWESVFLGTLVGGAS